MATRGDDGDDGAGDDISRMTLMTTKMRMVMITRMTLMTRMLMTMLVVKVGL